MRNPKKNNHMHGGHYGAIGAVGAFLIAAIVLMSSLGLFRAPSEDSTVLQSQNEVYSVVSVPDYDLGDIEESAPSMSDTPLGNAEVFFIDVGQGDAALILEGGMALLIDAGVVGSGDYLVDYISGLGIARLDYVVATHNHADHIGGMADVINYFDIGVFFTTATPATTATYERMLTALEAKPDIEVVIPVPGDSYTFPNSNFIFFGPFNSHLEFSNQNASSLVLKYTNGEHSFLFMGDAEAATERDLLDSASNVSADVIKLGHHGSSSSSTPAFIDAVNPLMAVISCGANNEYGHPHNGTIDTLNVRNIETYRTDARGTVYMSSDGHSLVVETER